MHHVIFIENYHSRKIKLKPFGTLLKVVRKILYIPLRLFILPLKVIYCIQFKNKNKPSS